MMTKQEKLQMFKEKNSFIRRLDLALTTPVPKGMTITGVDYEVWEREVEGTTWYQEIIVLTFKGGGMLPISANGNSNSANFEAIATNINGGDYSFSPTYKRIKELWKQVDLDE